MYLSPCSVRRVQQEFVQQAGGVAQRAGDVLHQTRPHQDACRKQD